MRLRNGLFCFLTANMDGKPYTEDPILAPLLKQKYRLTERFDAWMTQFNGLRGRVSQAADTTYRSHLLLVHWHVSIMLLESDYPTDASVFGTVPNLRARGVLDLAASVVSYDGYGTPASKSCAQPQRKFSTETGIVAPLFTLAMKCADEYVTTRATELLVIAERREGLYEAQSMVAVVRKFATARQRKDSHSDTQLPAQTTKFSFVSTDLKLTCLTYMHNREGFVARLSYRIYSTTRHSAQLGVVRTYRDQIVDTAQRFGISHHGAN